MTTYRGVERYIPAQPLRFIDRPQEYGYAAHGRRSTATRADQEEDQARLRLSAPPVEGHAQLAHFESLGDESAVEAFWQHALARAADCGLAVTPVPTDAS